MLKKNVQQLRELLIKKGVSLDIILEEKGRLLLYVYRKDRLEQDLSCPVVSDFLKKYGYNPLNISSVIDTLKSRFTGCNIDGKFPHEIGLFLGYPIKDVIGFIKNGGKNYVYSGYWKVYDEEENATSVFASYDKCFAVYRRLSSQGANIFRLTVAC